MLWPLGIEHPYERTHYVTYAIVGVCVLLEVLRWALPESALMSLALWPRDLSLHQLLTSGVMHVGVLHLLGNMLFLVIYGRYVEERLGHGRFLAAYAAFELCGNLAYIASGALFPSVGASGAISGLTGFVLVGAPWAQVRVVYQWGPHVRDPFHVAVFWLLVPWVLLEVMSTTAARHQDMGVYAHLGGFAAGAALAAVLRNPRLIGTRWYLDPALPGGGVAATRRLRRSRGAALRPTPGSTPPPSPFRVVLLGVESAPSRVAVIKLLMARRALEPDDANRLLTGIGPGQPHTLGFPDRPAAEAFAAQARELGVELRLEVPRLP